jgi:hypothetical protein
MARQKRTTTKTGPNTTRTVTHTKKGVRVTTSNKPSKTAPRVTTSVNLSDGNRRVTHSRKLGGGWWDRTTKSQNTIYKFKPDKSRKSSGGNYSDNSGDGSYDSWTSRIDSSEFKWWQKVIWFFVKPIINIFQAIFEIVFTLVVAGLLYFLGLFLLIIGAAILLWMLGLT